MVTDTSERKAATKAGGHVGAPPPEAEHLPCPRCDSTNTKFCYYNNYNFSQPRHFCKACRRYWTRGGALRDIPVGGGTRKHAKRSRTTPSSAATATTTATATEFSSGHHRDFRHLPAAASQLLAPFAADHGGGYGPFEGDAKMGGSFTNLLNSTHHHGGGFLGLGGFGIGLDDVGFGLGRAAAWPFPAVVEGRPTGGNGGGLNAAGGHTWQLENGQSGLIGAGDYFAFPDLAISTPASLLK